MGKTILAVMAGPATILFVRVLWWIATADTTPFGRNDIGAIVTFLGFAASGGALALRFCLKAETNG